MSKKPTTPEAKSEKRAAAAARRIATMLTKALIAHAAACDEFGAAAASGRSHTYDASFRRVDPAEIVADWKRKASRARTIAASLTYADGKRNLRAMTDVAAWIVDGVDIAER